MTALSLHDFMSQRFSFGGHPVTRLFSQRLGALLAWFAYQLGLSPNTVTSLALLASLLAALVLALFGGSPVAALAAVLLMQLSYGLDCADGQLARATGRTSALGAWWDVYCDLIAILALSFGLLVALQRLLPEFGLWLAFAVFLLTLGRCGSLFSSTIARRAGAGAAAREVGAARWLFTVMIDTPVILFLLPALSVWPRILLLYIAGLSTLFCVHGVYVGIKNARA